MIKRIFAKIQNISCYEASLLMSRGLDGELSLRDRFRLMSHTVVCDGCKLVRRQMEQLHQLFRLAFRRQAAGAVPHRTLSPEEKERIKQHLG